MVHPHSCIIIHPGTKNMLNIVNYLANVKKIGKSSALNIAFLSIICRTDIEVIDGNIKKVSSDLEILNSKIWAL